MINENTIKKIFGLDFVISGKSADETIESTRSIAVGEQLHPSPAKSHIVPSNNEGHQLMSSSPAVDGPSKPSKTPRIRTISGSDHPIEFISNVNVDSMKVDIQDTVKRKATPSKKNGDKLFERLQTILDQIKPETVSTEADSAKLEGLLGPSIVKYDVGSHVGSFVISSDRLGVNSQCNFGSIRASSCVYKGKWQYEVQLGSNGVMQVGWATLDTKFSQEKGVGDTIDSYAYDGNRLRKWNKSTAQYGETWQAGDIIGCCIDLDVGNIEFHRNGKTLGTAFTDIRRGKALAYFPAVSLAYQENIIANFGGTPLQFPVHGYSPLQSQQNSDNTKSKQLLIWLENALEFHNEPTVLVSINRIYELLGPHLHSGFVVEQAFFPFFAKLLGLPEKISHTDKIDVEFNRLQFEKVYRLLDTMWAYLEESEMKSCLERMTVVLMNQFRSNSLSLEYPFQRYSLLCLLALSKHRATRRHLIRNLLFAERGRLMHFLHVRPMDETVLKEIIIPPGETSKNDDVISSAESYFNASCCEEIRKSVDDLQSLQVEFLITLLTNDDGTDKRPSSRAIFLKKFRNHVRDVIRPGSVLHQQVQKALCTFFIFLKTIQKLHTIEVDSSTPFPSLPPSIFYDTSINYHDMERVGGLASYLYKNLHTEVAQKLSIPDYVVPNQPMQHQQVRNLPGIIRVSTGTSQSMPDSSQPANLADNVVQIVHSVEVGHDNTFNQQQQNVTNSATSSTTEVISSVGGNAIGGTLITGTPSGHNMLLPMLNYRSLDTFTLYPGGFLGFASLEHNRASSSVQPNNPAVTLLGKESGKVDSLYSLRELLDDAIVVFVSGVQANVEKVIALRKTMNQYKEALEKLQKQKTVLTNPVELLKSIEVFKQKLDEQSRHMAWVTAAVFTKERQILVYELLKTVLNTLRGASSEGSLFAFVPEHYITTLINLNWLIISQMHPTVDFHDLPDLPNLLPQIAQFIALHFSDTRIIIAETKDTLTQALTSFICNPTMLNALEQMPNEDQEKMIRAILRPYENRAWAQSNWMLVRIWQGDGFGFQYPNSTEARRSFRAKPVQDEFGISTDLAPTPSKILQTHVKNVLLNDQKFAAQYVHSVLNQLNWAFSEFVGLLQEIQTASARPERIFIESRQLKICCTCFELTQALLRVMEMVVSIAGPVLTDFERDKSEQLLGRLCMLLSQVLNRISSSTGCFANVIELDIPGLENVTYFPVLSAVAGILIGLVRNEVAQDDQEHPIIPATKTLISEPSFQIKSLDFGKIQSQTEGKFSLVDHLNLDITENEMDELQAILAHLNHWTDKIITESESEELDEDLICTICYAYSKNCTIRPCGHRTCKTCILHHLMNRGECFFCKAVIQQVFLDDGSKIHDTNSTARINEENSP